MPSIPSAASRVALPEGANCVYLVYGVDADGTFQPVSQNNPLPTTGSGADGAAAAVTIAAGADTTEGNTTDAAVVTNTTGTVSGKLRGLVAILADVWDSVKHLLHVDVKQVGSADFALGQQLAAASLPVVLTAAQITTLTPVSTVTANLGTIGTAATAAKQDTGNTSLGAINTDTTSLVAKDFATQTTLAALNTKVTACNTGAVVLAAGSAVVGHVITDTSSVMAASGDVASGATDSGNPVKIGGLAKTSNPTAVTSGQRVAQLYDKLGKSISVEAIRDLKGVQKTTITSSTGETTIVTADATNFLDVYGLFIANTSGTACNVTIKDATSGTTRAILAIPAGDTRGFLMSVGSAIPQAANNSNWTATCSASVASIEITALYVKNL